MLVEFHYPTVFISRLVQKKMFVLEKIWTVDCITKFKFSLSLPFLYFIIKEKTQKLKYLKTEGNGNEVKFIVRSF